MIDALGYASPTALLIESAVSQQAQWPVQEAGIRALEAEHAMAVSR